MGSILRETTRFPGVRPTESGATFILAEWCIRRPRGRGGGLLGPEGISQGHGAQQYEHESRWRPWCGHGQIEPRLHGARERGSVDSHGKSLTSASGCPHKRTVGNSIDGARLRSRDCCHTSLELPESKIARGSRFRTGAMTSNVYD